MPGDGGGANWGNGAIDPETGMMYIRSGDSGEIRRITEVRGWVNGLLHELAHFMMDPPPMRRGGVELGLENQDHIRPLGGGLSKIDRLPYPAGQMRYTATYGGQLYTASHLPAGRPPWVTLTAYDLNEGTIKWQIPLGTVPMLVAKGIANTGQAEVGASHLNSPAVTAGGLVFITTWADRMIHALDKDTGKALWEKEIDSNPANIPAVYEVGGREYVAFAAVTPGYDVGPGEGRLYKSAKRGAAGYYVFALPKPKR